MKPQTVAIGLAFALAACKQQPANTAGTVVANAPASAVDAGSTERSAGTLQDNAIAEHRGRPATDAAQRGSADTLVPTAHDRSNAAWRAPQEPAREHGIARAPASGDRDDGARFQPPPPERTTAPGPQGNRITEHRGQLEKADRRRRQEGIPPT